MPNPLDNMVTYIPEYSQSNPEVSSWTVGMQIQHCCLATIGICQSVLDSIPGEKKQSFSLMRFILMVTGKIPRGRVESPEAAKPDENISQGELEELVTKAKALTEQLRSAPVDSWWEHFSLGVLKRDSVIDFLGIHNRHHLAVIKDILSDQQSTA